MPGPKASAAKCSASHKQPASDGLVVLHRSRFVDWQPAPIVSLASSHDGSLVAILRETGDVELYDTSNWHCFQTFPGSTAAATSCVAVVNEDGGASCRLFTAGFDGLIYEQDPETRQPSSSCDSYGGAVWQLEPEPLPCVAQGTLSRLAAACDDGCLRLFSVDVGIPGAAYSKSFPKVEGRTLAVAWHPDGKAIASAGTDGCIHIWAMEANRELLRITSGDTTGRRDYCVWDLLFLPDGTLVSADSDGSVQFWDGRFGTLLRKFNQHNADALRLAASPDGRTVFAAGVDAQLAVFHLVQGGGGSPQWAYLSSKRTHTHDVRAMCVLHGKHTPEGVLLTGGNDTQLLAHSVSRFLKEHPQKLNPCPQRPLCQASLPAESVAPAKPSSEKGAGGSSQPQFQPPRLLCAHRNQLDVWQLGMAAGGYQGGSERGEGAMITPGVPPLHIARFQSKSGSFLTAAALSPAGNQVAFSDAKRIHAFQLAERPLPSGDGPSLATFGSPPPAASPAVTPLSLPGNLPPASHLAFLPDSGSLVACALDGTIRVVELAGAEKGSVAGGAEAGGNPGEDPSKLDPSAAAAGSGGGRVHVIRDIYNLRHKIWAKRERHKSAARRFAPAVDLLSASPDGRWLAVAARQRVHLIDLKADKPSATQLPPPCDPPRPITALTFTDDSATLLVGTAVPGTAKSALPQAGSACQLAVYDVATAQPSAWAQAHGEELNQRLRAFPGPAAGISCSQSSTRSFLVHSSAAICHIDMSKPLSLNPYYTLAAGIKRRRGPSRPLQTTAPAGENCRILYAEDPVLHVQYVMQDSVLVVEKAWSDVWQQLPAPVYRHRYGT